MIKITRHEYDSLLRQSQELAELESALILADNEFNGDSEHSSPKERLLDSIRRLRDKARKVDVDAFLTRNSGKTGLDITIMTDKMMQGYGIGMLIKWANEDARWKSPKARERFLRHVDRAYASFRIDHETITEVEADQGKDQSEASVSPAETIDGN